MQDKVFTKRLVFRKIKLKDINIVSQWANSQEACGEYLAIENSSYDDSVLKFENDSFWNDNSKTYIIELKESLIPIGTIKYWTKTESHKTAMMAVKIAVPNYRGHGYGTEAQKALIRELFKKYGFDAIEMYTDINNIAQQRCLEKLDFKNTKLDEYTDSELVRQGYLYRLTKDKYESSGVHIFYYD